MIQSLLPKIIRSEDPSYKTVKELKDILTHALDKRDIRNIALTGPYGSGKSSIIQTLKSENILYQSKRVLKNLFKKREYIYLSEPNYLFISLATLQTDHDGGYCIKEKNNNEEYEKQTEAINRKIEYSILQQLLYKEKAEILPNSRFSRIVHYPKNKLYCYSILVLLFLILFLIVFEPSFLRVETICRMLDFGDNNKYFDLVASIALLLYVFGGAYILIKKIIKIYSNSKLNKLNLKDGDIEIIEDKSIFNKHLDEILYFFQATKYNVVVIEDLDRFETERIFLKLRELNQLINESKIVGRHIVFVYAIKDDIFKDEARTKFFDYIIPVIPVINSSNSKDQLKSAIKARGFDENEISDEDLSEIAFFIQDMRILINIANEYSQYRERIYDPNKRNLDLAKLLAMIVYKNYYPKDFAQLHRREGSVYKCISSKYLLIAEA